MMRFRKIDASPIIREYGEPSLSLEPPDEYPTTDAANFIPSFIY
jgi:hypothetical protein